MAENQGMERGSIEGSRVGLSSSAPGPNPEGDSRTDKEVTIKPTKGDEQESAQSSQVSPRRCHHPSQATTRDTSPALSLSSSGRSPVPPTPVAARQRRLLLQPLEPPVTKTSLGELEVSKIINNPKLRHDINFDPELHFRPNVDGDKGRKKHDRASLFWTSLRDQLVLFVGDRLRFYEKYGTDDDWCLPKLLTAVKEIIQTLVPQRDRQFLDEGLNVDLVMQQFHKGIADLEKLALWLSGVLKSHCAPMRDEWVDSMYNQLSHGNASNDVDELVTGMRSLLSVLEAMKLDVANHQIRCLRPALIEETTAFEQKFLMKKLRNRKMDVSDARPWYREAAHSFPSNIAPSNSSKFGEMGVFFEGLIRSMLPPVGGRRPLPSTFFFDDDRLSRVRSDMLDAINLDVCMRMYDDLERVSRYRTAPAFTNYHANDDAASASTSSVDFNFNTPPSSSRPSSIVLSNAGSAASSPRSSSALPSYLVPESAEVKAKARSLRDSLVALLQTGSTETHHSQRWRVMAPAMALQIFRFTNAPTEMLPSFEDKLAENVSSITSPLFQEVEDAYRAKLASELADRVHYFKDLSGVCLFSIATGNRVPNKSLDPSRDGVLDAAIRVGQQEGGIEDIATRIAHVGVIHWRIWAQLAYVDQDDMSID